MIYHTFFSSRSCLWMRLGFWHLKSLKCKTFHSNVTLISYQPALHISTCSHYKFQSSQLPQMGMSYLCAASSLIGGCCVFTSTCVALKLLKTCESVFPADPRRTVVVINSTFPVYAPPFPVTSQFFFFFFRFTCCFNNIAYLSYTYLSPGEQKRSGDRGPETTPKSLLLKPGQSGLRPPGFSALPAARLATFGFVRSSSVSSVSSNQSNESGPSDPCRASQRKLLLNLKLVQTVPDIRKCCLIKNDVPHSCFIISASPYCSPVVAAAPAILSYYSNSHSLPFNFRSFFTSRRWKLLQHKGFDEEIFKSLSSLCCLSSACSLQHFI